MPFYSDSNYYYNFENDQKILQIWRNGIIQYTLQVKFITEKIYEINAISYNSKVYIVFQSKPDLFFGVFNLNTDAAVKCNRVNLMNQRVIVSKLFLLNQRIYIAILCKHNKFGVWNPITNLNIAFFNLAQMRESEINLVNYNKLRIEYDISHALGEDYTDFCHIDDDGKITFYFLNSIGTIISLSVETPLKSDISLSSSIYHQFAIVGKSEQSFEEPETTGEYKSIIALSLFGSKITILAILQSSDSSDQNILYRDCIIYHFLLKSTLILDAIKPTYSAFEIERINCKLSNTSFRLCSTKSNLPGYIIKLPDKLQFVFFNWVHAFTNIFEYFGLNQDTILSQDEIDPNISEILDSVPKNSTIIPLIECEKDKFDQQSQPFTIDGFVLDTKKDEENPLYDLHVYLSPRDNFDVDRHNLVRYFTFTINDLLNYGSKYSLINTPTYLNTDIILNILNSRDMTKNSQNPIHLLKALGETNSQSLNFPDYTLLHTCRLPFIITNDNILPDTTYFDPHDSNIKTTFEYSPKNRNMLSTTLKQYTDFLNDCGLIEKRLNQLHNSQTIEQSALKVDMDALLIRLEKSQSKINQMMDRLYGLKQRVSALSRNESYFLARIGTLTSDPSEMNYVKTALMDLTNKLAKYLTPSLNDIQNLEYRLETLVLESDLTEQSVTKCKLKEETLKQLNSSSNTTDKNYNEKQRKIGENHISHLKSMVKEQNTIIMDLVRRLQKFHIPSLVF